MTPDLFDPLQVGALVLRNRIVMAPMTRGRATRDFVPTAIMAEYYGQRASAGLIISEGIGISQEGLGWPYAPGLWTSAQVEAWKPVTDAVHAGGGLIVAQLWHMGRVVHPSYNGGLKPIAPSPLRAQGQARTYASPAEGETDDLLPEAKFDYEEPRALRSNEVFRLLSDYRQAAITLSRPASTASRSRPRTATSSTSSSAMP